MEAAGSGTRDAMAGAANHSLLLCSALARPLQGMFDAQLEHVTRVLQKQRIWAINVGENFRISGKAWHAFCNALPDTRVGFMYVSEHHLMGSNLKLRMRDHIRANRK
jgi:hypothetical protein